MHLAINGYFLDQPTTGTGQYTQQLLGELDETWPGRVSVLLPPHAQAEQAFPSTSKVQVHLLPVPFHGHLGKVWFEQVAVPRAAKSLKAKLLHVPYFGPPLRCALPVVVTVHDLIQLVVPRLRGGPEMRVSTFLAAAAARRSAAILADSEHTRQDVLTHLRVSPERVYRSI